MIALKRFIKSWLLQSYLAEHGDRKRSAVALTFDDGPNPDFTPRVLDVLSRYQATGTFFLVGNNAALHPTLVDRLNREGHEVANHSMTHAEFDLLGRKQVAEEIDSCDQLLRSMGVKLDRIWFRPPKGALTFSVLAQARRRKQRLAMWSSDPKDYRAQSADEIWSYFQQTPIRPGDIVLLHDKTEATVNVLPALLDHLRQRNLQPVTLSALLI